MKMVKKGGKMRTRSTISEDEDSANRFCQNFQNLEEPLTAMTNTQQNRRSMTQGGNGSIHKLSEAYDNIHNPFFLHSADHPGLTIVVHTLDGSNYNSWLIAMKII